MSFVLNALAQYNAILGLNNAQFSAMQNNQSRLSLANRAASAVSFGSSVPMDSFVRADKQLEMENAKNGFMALAYSTQLESLKKNQDKQIKDSFSYFA